MAYKQGNPLVKFVIFAAIVFAGYKFGLPWLKQHPIPGMGSSARPSPHVGCVRHAEFAVGTWSDGVARFMNPPVDSAAWSSFRSSVSGAITRAEGSCGGDSPSARKARETLTALRSLMNDMDGAVRSGGPPSSDIVRAQERINRLIEEARTLANRGD